MGTTYVSGGFAAQSVIKKLDTTYTFTAGAYLTLTPGVVYGTPSGVPAAEESMPGNFLLGEVPVHSFIASAVLKKLDTTFTFTAASIIRLPTQQRTFVAESLLVPASGYRFTVAIDTVEDATIVGLYQSGAGVSTTKLERTIVGSGVWSTVYTVSGHSFTYTDRTAPFGVTFRYRFTSYDSNSNVVLTAESSDITPADPGTPDKWSLLVPGYYSISLTVVDSSYSREIQSETFSPLGTSNKTTLTGETLGRKGQITAVLSKDERATSLAVIQSISESPRQSYLRSPFGLVIPVVIGAVSETLIDGGHSSVTISYVENGVI